MRKLFLIIICIVFCKDMEIFEEFYKEAEEYMSNMTIEQKISQLFFPRFNNSDKEEVINNTSPGGFVLFGIDFDDTEENVIKKIDYIQQLSNNSINLPLGLAVDEEGGIVNRISPYHRKKGIFPSPQEIYNESGIEGILNIEEEKRDLLRKFKININLAPVADISYNSSDFIYSRTLGRLPEETAEYIDKEVESYTNDNFSCCLKHFPGYGNNSDTHTGIAIDDRPYEQFLKEDFLTFEAGIRQKTPMILVSHNIVTCKDKNYPASISKTWHDILRNDLNYSGLILTDDLSMGAIKNYTGDESPAVLAVKAGNDVLLTSDYYEHLNAVINATLNNSISEEIIDKACRRVIAWKIKYLINAEKDDEKEEEEEKEEEKGEEKGEEKEEEEGGKGEKGEEEEKRKEEEEEGEKGGEEEKRKEEEEEGEKGGEEEKEEEEEEEEGGDKRKTPEESENDYTVLIVCLVIGGVILIVIILFIIKHYFFKPKEPIEQNPSKESLVPLQTKASEDTPILEDK